MILRLPDPEPIPDLDDEQKVRLVALRMVAPAVARPFGSANVYDLIRLADWVLTGRDPIADGDSDGDSEPDEDAPEDSE